MYGFLGLRINGGDGFVLASVKLEAYIIVISGAEEGRDR